QQIAPRLAASRRFDVQRETPLAFERLALRRGGETDALHGEAGPFERPQGNIMIVVGNLAYNDAVDDRSIDAHRRCSRGSADTGGNQRAAQSGSLQKTPAIQRRHALPPI